MVADYTQVHWFCGIGGWPLALEMAGWGDRPVWSGSCPCQPFSNAGSRKGEQDERHLWPAWYGLLKVCRPPVVFGEQVSSSLGRTWLDSVRADLEESEYAVAAVDLPACSVGAPHRRQRLWWVGHAEGERFDGSEDPAGPGGGRGAEDDGRMGNADIPRSQGRGPVRQRADQRAAGEAGVVGGLAHADGGQPGHRGLQPSGEHGLESQDRGSPWQVEWVACADGRTRPVPASQPALFPLAPGLPGRVGVLRGAGNAICPQLASEFVKAYLECRP
ncbi:MAG: DNA cytosine methyltransferase [bacterium]|nr:DNA cytosine methyltransferase [bacterium]